MASDGAESAVLTTRRDGVLILTLNRPASANALNTALRRDLEQAKRQIAADPSVRVVIVTGAGRHFCAGADLREGREQRRAGLAAHPAAADFGQLPQPVLAAINGAALGGGCELALTCDFRFMASTASIGLPEITFGTLPRGGGTALLPRIVGLARARQMIMTGEPVGAARAEQIGLADGVAGPGELMDLALEFAGRLSAQPAYALRTAKRLLAESLETDLATAREAERVAVREMATDAERARARADAAAWLPAYARIFGTPGASRPAGEQNDRPRP
ncbi:MAG TPA: enoyl-CoA hydratase/isomerase family protein [Streptosporangiaceae bacterium]|jgi:enoyl-CoA hydratase